MRWNVHRLAGTSVLLKTPIAIPTELREMSIRRNDDPGASISVTGEAALAVPVVAQ
jgi:hypothetical protein